MVEVGNFIHFLSAHLGSMWLYVEALESYVASRGGLKRSLQLKHGF
jgi:hypothetical protein